MISREEYFKASREKISVYKNKIGSKLNIDLGDIIVEEFSSLPLFYKNELKKAIQTQYKNESFKNILGSINGFFSDQANFCKNLSLFYAGYFINSKNYIAVYAIISDSPYIFMNTSEVTRSLIDRKRYDLDCVVIHELSHHLWILLGGSNGVDGNGTGKWTRFRTYNDKGLKRMSEGFAEFCSRILFANLYDNPAAIDHSVLQRMPEILISMMRVKKIVEKFGPEIILEIPKNWKELDEKTPYELNGLF